MVVLLAGYAFANTLNWNRPLLLALGHPLYPLMVAAITGAVEIILLFTLLPTGNYLLGAAIFAAYLAISVSWNAVRGITFLRQQEAS
jgi:O-antigen/teichoic acid export membrane protein